MTTISAKSILASRHAQSGDRIDTLLLRYPRWIHAEFMTHRVFSRNAASSRAIPVEKLIKDVLDDPAVPLFWGANQKGMQAGEECDAKLLMKFEMIPPGTTTTVGFGAVAGRGYAWLMARDRAVEAARAFANAGYHKQIVNRLLEPFAHITVVVTATEWSNFFALRDHPDAEPHIQMLAREMKVAMAEAKVQTLEPGQWHTPFAEREELLKIWMEDHECVLDTKEMIDIAIKLSVARCASTSYRTVDGFDMTLDRAIELHNKLVSSTPMHASPAEHQAQADLLINHGHGCDGPMTSWKSPKLHGNLKGFIQYRKTLEGECQ